jgi:hypothetical protein
VLALYLAIEAAFGEKTRHDQEPQWKVVRDLARRSGDATLVATTAALEGIALFNGGHWQASFDLIEPAERALRRLRRDQSWDVASRLTFMRLTRFFAGDLNGYLQLALQHRQETKQIGDLLEYAASVQHGVWDLLRKDDSDATRKAAEEASRNFPMPSLREANDWPAAYVLAHCDLYDRDVPGLRDRMERAWPMLTRSGVLRTSLWGTSFFLLRAYSTLLSRGTRGDVRRAKKLGVDLVRSRLRWKAGFGHALEACIAVREGTLGMATSALRLAFEAFEREGLMLYAACARRRHGELAGGEEGAAGVDAADAFMRSQGISNPERWCAMYVPLPEGRAHASLPPFGGIEADSVVV